MQRIIKFFLTILITHCVFQLMAQDPLRFSKDIEEMKSEKLKSTDGLIIFTGSSSIRMWKDVAERFPDYNIVNRGFGGSQMSDLLYFLDDIVIRSKPCQV
ncbi:MAG: hypothetical protein KDC80_10575, partial [Saprospiraceae bacterium]|nr:hypothetical protein [Saprospiraceae bacterium]